MPPKENERNEFELIALEEKIDSLEYDLYIAKEQLKNAIPISEGATNGDMIKAMFNDFESALLLQVISKEWWNAPYKDGCNLSENPTGSESKSRGCGICHYNDGVVHAECVLCDKAESEDKE